MKKFNSNSAKRVRYLMVLLLVSTSFNLKSQVKITDNSNLTIDPNSILELESNNKGILIPRVILNNLSVASPLSAPVPEGMLVYSVGGALKDGFYFWDGNCWTSVTDSKSYLSVLSLSSSDTLEKKNIVVLASNDITITLPEITADDNGLRINIKNTGNYKDLVTVCGYGSSKIDNLDDVEILPTLGYTLIASGGNWHISDKVSSTDEILDVGSDEPFKTISEALGFLEEHMDKSVAIRLADDQFSVDTTLEINLPFPVTIQGISYGANIISAGSGLSGKPMFRCLTECYFKMLVFDATTLADYGTQPGEDAIRFAGQGTYHEIKDCTFDRFYNAVFDSTDAEVWLFECDISNSQNCGILIHSNLPGTVFRVSETDFMYNKTGIKLSKGSSAVIQLLSGFYTNGVTDTAIDYNPADFSFTSMFISNNSWNHEGIGMTGFDFSRSDGRDANAFIENNAGMESNRPHCKINVVNNASTTTCTTANSWYKANWTNTSDYRTNIAVNNNKITYLSSHSRDVIIFISGNVQVGNTNRVITVGIAKNGNSAVRYGETTLRITVANQPFQFSTVIYLEDVKKDDYFELFCSSANNGDVLTFQDLNWFVTTE